MWIDKAKDKEKSSALKRLQKSRSAESVSNPMDFLGDLIEGEWNHAEQNGGKTFMGKVVKGLTRKIMDIRSIALWQPAQVGKVMTDREQRPLRRWSLLALPSMSSWVVL